MIRTHTFFPITWGTVTEQLSGFKQNTATLERQVVLHLSASNRSVITGVFCHVENHLSDSIKLLSSTNFSRTDSAVPNWNSLFQLFVNATIIALPLQPSTPGWLDGIWCVVIVIADWRHCIEQTGVGLGLCILIWSWLFTLIQRWQLSKTRVYGPYHPFTQSTSPKYFANPHFAGIEEHFTKYPFSALAPVEFSHSKRWLSS